MHPLIEDILKASIDRGAGPPDLQPGESRDLISLAETMKARGVIPIIAEIKPRILGRPLNPDEVARYARTYSSCGACALSVLTEPDYFMGSIDNIRISRKASKLPILRKDFIIDERQLREVKTDLILLIATLGIDLKAFVDRAISYEMEPLVEVHTAEEMELALRTNANIIGINNRSLRTLDVDLNTFQRLASLATNAGVFLVAESGVRNHEDAIRMVNAGADALLVGTALMERPEMLAELNGWKRFRG